MVTMTTAVIILFGGTTAIWGIQSMKGAMNRLEGARAMSTASGAVAKANSDLNNAILQNYLVSPSAAGAAVVEQNIDTLDRSISEVDRVAATADAKTANNSLKKASSSYKSLIAEMAAAGAAQDAQSRANRADELQKNNDAATAAAEKLQSQAAADMSDAIVSFDFIRTSGVPVILAITLVGSIFILSFGYFVNNSINEPIQRIVDAAIKIGEGDLTVHLHATGKDEFGMLENMVEFMAERLRVTLSGETEAKALLESQVAELSSLARQAAEGDLSVQAPEYDGSLGELSRSFNLMTGGLKALAEKMADVINHLSSASSQIEVTAQQQASGSNEQAASVSEVTAAVNQLATNAKEVAKAAASVSEAANESMDGVRKGQEAVEDATTGMEEIKEAAYSNAQKIMALEEKSQEIGSILAIIDDIAEQTNLLALNAAIEAARAGEAGKGFAVVAQEIRNLAEDVTSSTKEIGNKIKEIQAAVNSSVMATEENQKRTEEEVRVVKEAGKGLEQINELTERTAELAMQISGAVQQQRTASEQVVETMNEVSEVARQSALGSQESVKSAQDLANMAADLKGMISNFKLD
jgi:methyl-accepting chemotaxis protein